MNLPNMTDLYLSSTKVTNNCLATIMKYNIKKMKVHLTDCNGVTLKALNKYIRSDYDNDIVEQYVYCNKLIYFANQDETQQLTDNYRQNRVGKNRAKKWKSRR